MCLLHLCASRTRADGTPSQILHSSIKLINQIYREVFIGKATPTDMKNKVQKLEELLDCICQLELFCFDDKDLSQEQYQLNTLFYRKNVNTSRQTLIREQGIIRLVTIILKNIIPVRLECSNKLKQILIMNDLKDLDIESIVNPQQTKTNSMSPRQLSMEQEQSSMPDMRSSHFRIQDTKTPKADKQNQQKEIFLKMKEVASKSYSFLVKACLNNYKNQKLCMRYIFVYKEHIGLNIHAEQFMQSIIENNEDILMNLYKYNVRDSIELGDESQSFYLIQQLSHKIWGQSLQSMQQSPNIGNYQLTQNQKQFRFSTVISKSRTRGRLAPLRRRPTSAGYSEPDPAV